MPLKKQQKYFVSVATDVNTHQEYQSNRLFSFLGQKWEALDHVIYGQEMRIYKNGSGKTTFALLPSSLIDNILLFCDGKIIGDSTHDSLLEEEHYREMFKSQESWYA